jgi:pilus assembly protein Flp/PilA
MASFISKCKTFARNEDGATSIEYALIASIISISIVVALTNVKTELQGTMTKVQTELKNAAN